MTLLFGATAAPADGTDDARGRPAEAGANLVVAAPESALADQLVDIAAQAIKVRRAVARAEATESAARVAGLRAIAGVAEADRKAALAKVPGATDDEALSQSLAAAAIARLGARERASAAEREYAAASRGAKAAARVARREYTRYLFFLAQAGVGLPDTCPIDGPLEFGPTFGAPRDGGTRRHKGNDLFSPRGTANVALTSGWLTRSAGDKGGRGAWIEAPDGDRYYYAHLDGWFGPYPREVKTGDLIGFTGDTGNARGDATHTHFEYHPGGGRAIDPYPLLTSLCR